MHYSIVLTILATYLSVVSGQSCSTPNGLPGECISLFNCQPLLDILQNTHKSPQDTDFLKRSRCGLQGSIPMVCCSNGTVTTETTVTYTSNDCVSPDGVNGMCINLYQCNDLAHMLKPPVSQRNIDYIKKSRCKDNFKNSVCCAPPKSPGTPTPEICQNTVSAYPPDPLTECCGRDNRIGNKIAGGNATTIDQYPWLVLIDYELNGAMKQVCGGSLISGRYVLTAAHCLSDDVLKRYGTPKLVRLGEYDKTKDGPDCDLVEAGGRDCTSGEVKIPIELIIPHPEHHKPVKHANDIALIRLARMAPFTDFIRPICLPSDDLTLSPPPNITLYTAGWGAVSEQQSSSDVKVHVDLPFVNHEQCQEAYNKPGSKIALSNKQICAGGVHGKDSCKGDTGGPLMYENGKVYEAVGVVSFGTSVCGELNMPSVYTKVLEYKDWILSNIKP